MIDKHWAKCIIFILLTLTAGQAAAEAIPAMNVNMVLTGALAPSSDGKLIPSDGDLVLAVNTTTGANEGTGSVSGASYSMIIADKPAAFNGTQLVLYIQHINTNYKLLKVDGSDAIVIFNGSFLPVRQSMNLLASSQAVSTTNPNPDPGTGNPSPTSLGDLNGDGAVNEVDVGLLKQAISGQITIDSTKMDINGDQVVNTRDLIDLIRIVREKSRIALKPVSIIPGR